MVFATIWGKQTAEKRVLLLHGLTSTSQFWHSIAEENLYLEVSFPSHRSYSTIRPAPQHFSVGDSQCISLCALSTGYFVTAPDLLGHGLAKRSSVYTITAMAEELLPLLKARGGGDHPYDVIIGHSLGGLVAAALLPHLASARPFRVVLIDPPFEVPPDRVAVDSREMAEVIRNPPTLEAILEMYPH
jgi:pimeloyl-ACP methyl ester carboxylesterase